MILATHILAGAVVGKHVSNPVLIAAASVALHFAMDHLRHGDYLSQRSTAGSVWKKVLTDLTVGFSMVSLMLLLNPENRLMTYRIFLGIFFSLLPDLSTLACKLFDAKFLKAVSRFHSTIHRFPSESPERKWNFRNSINDILISLIALVFLLS